MSSMTEDCATGIYGGGKQQARQPHSQAREDRTPNKVNRQKQPPNKTKTYRAKKHISTAGASNMRQPHEMASEESDEVANSKKQD